VLIYLYIFTLIVGAALLGASILLGGHDASGSGDGDAGQLDAGSSGAHTGGSDAGDLGGLLSMFASLRFWVFFLAFFGLTGLVFELLDLVGSSLATLGLASAMGLGVGTLASWAVRRLGGESGGNVPESGDYVGKTARVMVRVQQGAVGKVRVDVKGTSIDLLASGLDGEAFESDEEVLIVEMDGTRARVARVDGAKGETD
jgi:membrane protein implicated in regulation of membrane protease activity